MWKQACSQSSTGTTSHKTVLSKGSSLQILPCTVSQLLSASLLGTDRFAICDCELNQVSVLGIIRGFAPFVTYVQYSLDDMTGPPLNVKHWVNTEDCSLTTFAPPGTYVKVIGSLRNFTGQKSLLAMDVRCIMDLNEITSHMMEVVHAHMKLFRTEQEHKAFDVNMNITAASASGQVLRQPEDIYVNGLSKAQAQVLQVIQKFFVIPEGIGLNDLRRQLEHLSMPDIRTSLTFLMNEGHIFTTIDEHHFKSLEH